MSEWWSKVVADFQLNFIESDRWVSLLKGLGVTLEITACAVIIGIVLGAFVNSFVVITL